MQSRNVEERNILEHAQERIQYSKARDDSRRKSVVISKG